MERNNLPSLQINLATVIHILLLKSIVQVDCSSVTAVDEKLQHKSVISKSDHFHARMKRSENAFQREYLNEYYANYYNEYYSNYYDRVTYNNAAPPPFRKSIGFVGNSNPLNFAAAYGTTYSYTPVFKYKSTTHRKSHKLFVPV